MTIGLKCENVMNENIMSLLYCIDVGAIFAILDIYPNDLDFCTIVRKQSHSCFKNVCFMVTKDMSQKKKFFIHVP